MKTLVRKMGNLKLLKVELIGGTIFSATIFVESLIYNLFF